MKLSNVKNHDIIGNYCCQYGHMKNDCYAKRNIDLGIQAIWVLKDTTNLRFKKKKVPK